MPKIDPHHFTTSKFHEILLAIVNDETRYPRAESSPFVWVDIACIPQFRQSRIADSEIGRQARIFRYARRGYVWLTTTRSEDLLSLFPSAGAYLDIKRDPVRSLGVLCEVFSDPWFSSMWTLQELFLQEVASIICGAKICFLPWKQYPLNLLDIGGLASQYSRHGDGRDIARSTHETKRLLASFDQAWLRSGFQGISSASPLGVVACSSFRTSEFEVDRIYGIMQIFGDEFVVGKARIAATPGVIEQAFTMNEPSDELGSLVISRYPTMSQLFRHDETPLAGRAWRVCGKASVPPSLAKPTMLFSNDGSEYNSMSQCKFSTRVSDDNVTWALFDGKVCRLDTIVDYASKVFCVMDCIFDAGPKAPRQLLYDNVDTSILRDLDLDVHRFGLNSLWLILLGTKTLETSGAHDVMGLVVLKHGKGALENHRSRNAWHDGLEVIGAQAWARVGAIQL